jgi:hypothetical protein
MGPPRLTPPIPEGWPGALVPELHVALSVLYSPEWK